MPARFSAFGAAAFSRLSPVRESSSAWSDARKHAVARDIIQSVWIGDRLSTMERLAIQSFLDHGHPFHLYTYGPLANVPEGATVKCGTEVLAADEVFVYQRGPGKGSPSAFSNFFRYKMLLEKGGWWADLDAVCTRPLEFDEEHVTCAEREPNGTTHIACGLVKSPVGSPVAEYCWDVCRRANKRKLRWGQVGPKLFAEAVEKAGADVRVLEPDAFYPIDYWKTPELVTRTAMPTGCHSIHLWNSLWKKHDLDPNGEYPADCIYEQLKRRFGVRTCELETPPGASIEKPTESWSRRAADELGRLIGRRRATRDAA